MTITNNRQHDKGQSGKEKASQSKRRRGRPEKFYKIDDTPLNVARSFFGIPSDKFTRPKS